MIRKIVLEMEAEGSESLAEQITRMMLDRVDLSGEFSLQQEIIPEDISEKKVPRMPEVLYEKKELQIPSFLQKGFMSQQEKGMREALYKKQEGEKIYG